MATDAETVVRQAYHAADGDVLDVQGFVGLFAVDGVFNPIGGDGYRSEHLGFASAVAASTAAAS